MKLLSTPVPVALAACLLLGMTATAHAQRVVRDVVTGELRAPTAAEAKQLDDLARAMRNRVSRGVLTGALNPKPIRQADGGDLLEATDDDQMYSVVVLGKDGQLVRHCVSNPELAARMGRGEITAFAPNLMERMNER